MNRKIINIVLLTLLALVLSSSTALASDPLKVGGTVDVGVLDGAAVGVTVKPKLNWLRLDLAGTYNGIAPGVRAGATWDVFNFGITPSLTLEGGHTWEGKIPGVDKSPDIGLNYLNFHLGAEFGNRNRWRFFIHGGPSYVSVRTDNFQNTVTVGDGITINNPEFHAWILPTFKFGFALYF